MIVGTCTYKDSATRGNEMYRWVHVLYSFPVWVACGYVIDIGQEVIGGLYSTQLS